MSQERSARIKKPFSENREFGANSHPDPDPNLRKRRTIIYCATMLLAFPAVVLAAIAIGSTGVSLETVARVVVAPLLPQGWIDLSNIPESDRIIIWLLRTPRVLVAALAGIAFAVAGAIMQGLFKNSLASPDVVGTSSGGALGAVLALATGLASRSMLYLPLLSFLFALLTLFLVYRIAAIQGRTPITTLLLAGIAINAFIGALTSFLITLTWARFEIASGIIFWLLGGLDSRTWMHVWLLLPCVIAGLLLTGLHLRDLDVLSGGEEIARSLGVETEKVKKMLLTSAALLTGGAVAVCGVIGFVGIVVPHVVRLIIGPVHRRLIPASALTGATFLILADLLSRILNPPEEIRLGIITAFVGAPFFLYLLMRQKREVGCL